MDDDWQLLRQFTQHNSQEAFAALTARYLSLVYSTCRRELDDADLAEDVTQAVFLILARKASSLRREVVLSGWLFQTARFAAKNARTQETRRKATEQKAADTVREQQMKTKDAAWNDIEPLLNQSLAALRDGERECVLLRVFQGLSFVEAGAALGLSEEAARKRVTRSLEKMRLFFTKNGVIVPSTVLAVLLTAHAAKAAPAGLVAGHTTTAALTGSHAYQLSEGTLKAMKLVHLKTAASITVVVLGIGTYAVARGIVSTHSKPGHVLQQVSGKTLTAAQIAERCRAAYDALQSYQITTTVKSYDVTVANSQPFDSSASAAIQFIRPGKIHAEGTDIDGYAYAYISDGMETAETNRSIGGTWRRDKSTETAVASVGGIAAGGATTVPALLVHANIGIPLAFGSSDETTDPEVRESSLVGHPCYIVTSHSISATRSETQSLWIDEKTFLLRRIVSDYVHSEFTFFLGGKKHTLPASKTHDEQNITNQRLNQPIPDSVFALPPTQ